MYEIIKRILDYTGNYSNISNIVLNICSYVIPLCLIILWDLVAIFFKNLTNWRK